MTDAERQLNTALREEGVNVPGTPGEVKLTWERAGLGWKAIAVYHGVEVVCRKIRERSEGLHAELTFQTDKGKRIYYARTNLSAGKTRAELAKLIRIRHETVDWEGIIERISWELPDQMRVRDELVQMGAKFTPMTHSYLVSPILEDKEATILFAPGGAGKSTVAAGVAVSVGSGKEVVPGWLPCAEGNVLVLDWEGSREIWWERLQLICKGAELPPPGRVWYRAVTIGTLEDIVEEVSEQADHIDARLIIVDSVGLAAGATREGSGYEDTALRLFQALRFLNRAALLVDHVSADSLRGDQPAKKMYGSIYKVNLARNVYELRRELDPGQGGAEFVVHHTKVNHTAKQPPLGLRVLYHEDDGVTQAITFHRAEVRAPELEAGLPLAHRMERALRFGPMHTKALADQLDVKDNRVRNEISRKRDRFLRMDDGRVALQMNLEDEDGTY